MRWKSIRICCLSKPTLISHIGTLKTVNAPQLRSISISFDCGSSVFRNSTFLTIPTLEHLTLESHYCHISDFTINWARLKSLTLYAYFPFQELEIILQQTKFLEFCDIAVDTQDLAINTKYPPQINLPFLKVFHLNEEMRSSGCPSFLDLINAPILETFYLQGEFVKASASAFFERSPNIQELILRHLFNAESLMDVTELLRHCPSLTVLSLQRYRLYPFRVDLEPLHAHKFFETFIREDNFATCRRLEYFTFEGPMDISVQILRQFLEGKQCRIPMPNCLHPWKRVIIDVDGIVDEHVREQVLDLFEEKREEGLNVSLFKVRLSYASMPMYQCRLIPPSRTT